MLIAHLSDPHLRPQGVLYQGLVDSNAMFAAALARLGTLDPAPDLVIITGDLVDLGTAEEYAEARRMLDRVAPPVLAIPGNHDEREAFRDAFADRAWMPSSGPLHVEAGEYGPLRVLGFDITVPGQHHGEIDDEAEAWLAEALAREPDRPTILMMHQPPFACGIPYLDPYSCRGGEKLDALLRRFPAVERVLCGHVHRLMQLRFGGTLLCTAPSTATAIALRTTPDAAPASYLEPPGMLLHHWEPGRRLLTHLVPIGVFPGPFPFA